MNRKPSSSVSRRRFLGRAAQQAAVIGAATTLLPRGLEATPATEPSDHVQRVLALFDRVPDPVQSATLGKRTPSTGTGPFFYRGAPFRGKLTPWNEVGTPLVVSGRVWGLDTRCALAGAVMDVFQVGADGEYSLEGDFRCRARLLTSETGAYEFETVHPVPYEHPKGSDRWRSSHIHFVVGYPGYKTLATELQFTGDPKAAIDFNGRPEGLAKTVDQIEIRDRVCERCTFDIVLTPSSTRRQWL